MQLLKKFFKTKQPKLEKRNEEFNDKEYLLFKERAILEFIEHEKKAESCFKKQRINEINEVLFQYKDIFPNLIYDDNENVFLLYGHKFLYRVTGIKYPSGKLSYSLIPCLLNWLWVYNMVTLGRYFIEYETTKTKI